MAAGTCSARRGSRTVAPGAGWRAIVCAAIGFTIGLARPARADATDDRRALVMLRVLAYDNHLRERIGDEVRIVIVYPAGDRGAADSARWTAAFANARKLKVGSSVFYDKTVSRYTAGLTLAYDPTDHISLLAGAEAYADRAQLNTMTLVGTQTLFGGKLDVAYDTIATYAQVLVEHPLANLTLGARHEHQSAVGNSLVPRIALTKVIGRFHGKLLASQAFRAPGIENLNLSHGEHRAPDPLASTAAQ